MKSINYGFWIVKVLKTINNHLITVLNGMDRLKHRIRFIFGGSTKKILKKICKSKINYHYPIGWTNRCITLNRQRLTCTVYMTYFYKEYSNIELTS